MTYGPPPSSGPDQPWGTPPPAMSPYQPAPQLPTKAPAVAWLVPGAAVLAIIGAATPWFKPKGTATGASQGTLAGDSLYSWKDGRIGLLAPIVLVILAIGVVGLLTGRTPQRFNRGSRHPVVSAARGTIIAGVVSAVALVIAWFILPSQYKIDDGQGGKLSWDDAISRAKANGVNLSISRGPQIGFWLTIAAAALAIVAGVLMLMTTRNATPAPPPYGGYVPQPGSDLPSPPAPGYTSPPASGYTPPPPPAPGYTPPPPPPGYTAPGYNPPPPQQ